MSFSILNRKDHLRPSNSYLSVYDTKSLYSMKNEYRENVLRIVKKTLLGTNFSLWYSKNSVFISAIFNFVIINTCFVIFPQFFFHSKDIENLIDEILTEGEELSKPDNNIFPFFSKKTSDFVIRLFISNLIDSIILISLTLSYRFKEIKINKYMRQYTECAIEQENKIISDKYNCSISEEGNFNIEINLTNNNTKSLLTDNNYNFNYSNKYFFEYVINFPNLKNASSYLYKKLFLPREKEILNRIGAISIEIEIKYKNKLLKFIFIIIAILLCIPLIKYASQEKKLDYLEYFAILSLYFFVQRNLFVSLKKEQIQNISLLNQEYMNYGYYIYINNDMISIFYLKEEYRNYECFDKVKELNERFLKNFELN